MSITLSLSNRVSCTSTFTNGLTSAMLSLAETALDLPMSDWP